MKRTGRQRFDRYKARVLNPWSGAQWPAWAVREWLKRPRRPLVINRIAAVSQ